MASMMVVGGLMVSGTTVHATSPADGTTPVTYDSRTVLPDGNGQYGIIIPTAISFTDTNKTGDASIEITGINGYDLDKDWTASQVTASVVSVNGYKLKSGAKEVEYKIKMNGNTDDFESTMTTPTAGECEEICVSNNRQD